MSAFWSAYIIILSLGCLAFVIGVMVMAKSLKVTRDPDNTTGHDYDGIKEYDNPMPKWWQILYWAGVVFFIFYVCSHPGFWKHAEVYGGSYNR